jgi:glucose/mannose-6-phosphate isomerase
MNEQHEALKKFSYQINYSITNYKSHGLKATDFNNIIIAGLGGSGIGGKFVKAFFNAQSPVVIECISDYNLPAYANDKTLVIAASYSGYTEETISIFNDAKSRGCHILTSTTGGKLKELAAENNIYQLQMEGGFQPRMALGYSLTYLALIFGELLGTDVKSDLQHAAQAVADCDSYKEEASALFETIKAKTKAKFIVLTDGPCEAIATRFAQQIQENAKHECFVHILPEMNHNVIESYYGVLDSVFFIINSNQNERVNARMDFINGLLEVENHKVINIELEQYNWFNIYETIYRLDWLSLLLADYKGVDSLTVPNIMSLKDFLEHQ